MTSTSLYRYYDRYDVLLYVGITSRGVARNTEHDKSKQWWSFVDRQTIEHHATREIAEDAERKAIRAFRPPFNRQHNPSFEIVQAAYSAFRATVDSQSSDILALYSDFGKQIPLTYLGREGDRFLMSTSLVHARLVQSLVVAGNRPHKRVLAAGTRTQGRVVRIDRDGAVAVLTLNLLLHDDADADVPLVGGTLFIRYDPTLKGFEMKRIEVVQNRAKVAA